MRKYESWHKPEDILRAMEIQKNLRIRLGRQPSKRDFVKAGHYKVWMALYRHNKKSDQETSNISQTLDVLAIRKWLGETKNLHLVEKVFSDCIHALTPDRAQDILNKMCRDNLWNIY